ncbi:uncharacterized protein N7479_007155 [Penicillium vulpinum]|uniref:Allergen Asp f 4 n=1 Tax=Penicillium vulpinum TaxID=29845 RepID=A0A1V6S142_9EURO|nr:uncharacterized protein N7479_007155 [Penicillium vulpinum]KAJ5960005.1 hypothetical protein N7479_007155 [Penicillium vulpinum]OQE07454.1 hypothetical protein PENVUL_c013G02076 [Penicillium vulpinum]
MHFSNSVLLMTALTAGSAVARLHGHDRRHAHHRELDAQLQPAVTAAPVANVEKRGGEVVAATIDGQLVSWINNWFGEQGSTSSEAPSSTEAPVVPEPTVAPTSTTAAPVVKSTSEAEVISVVKPTAAPTSGSSSSVSSNWANYPTNGQYSRDGFGASTGSKRIGSLDWDYVGNVGSPWGSNLIRVEEDAASEYKHVIRFENDNAKAWTVVMWNSYGPTGGLNGFWSPNKALSFTVEPGHSIFVAIDDNSQGGWGAAEGEGLPTNFVGEYASTWGEFDMSNAQNDGFSGWDVSCIIAELANLEIAGMQICNHEGEKCSSISKGAASVVAGYTAADQGKPDLAIAQSAGPVRLVVNLGWSS